MGQFKERRNRERRDRRRAHELSKALDARESLARQYPNYEIVHEDIPIEPRFPKESKLFGHRIELQPSKKVLRIDEWEIPIEKMKSVRKDASHGLGLTVETFLKSIYRGDKLILRFYRDGTVYLVTGEGRYGEKITALNIRDGVLEIHYRSAFIAPLKPEPLQIGVKYDMGIDVSGMQDVGMLERLRMKFGYDNVDKLISDMKVGRYMVVAGYDNGMTKECTSSEIKFKVPPGAIQLQWVKIDLSLRGMAEELNNRLKTAKSEEERQEVIASSTTLIGNIGERLTEAKKKGELFELVSELTGIPKNELLLTGPNRKGPDSIFFHMGTDQIVAIVEVKSTLNKDYLSDCAKDATDDLLTKYFIRDEFKHTKYGMPVGVYFNVEQLLSTDLSGGFEIIVGEAVEN